MLSPNLIPPRYVPPIWTNPRNNQKKFFPLDIYKYTDQKLCRYHYYVYTIATNVWTTCFLKKCLVFLSGYLLLKDICLSPRMWFSMFTDFMNSIVGRSPVFGDMQRMRNWQVKGVLVEKLNIYWICKHRKSHLGNFQRRK